MKKVIGLFFASFLLVTLSGFTVYQLPSKQPGAKKDKLTNGPVWFSCNHGYIHSCDDFVERYYIRDGEAGDTYEWYWNPNNPGIPTQYLGSNDYADVTMAPGDELRVVVHSQSYGTYEYWDTAPPCE